MDAVAVSDLTKRFGAIAPLRECSFAVPEGKVFGLLGPNGAGKTTLIRILLGYMRLSGGSATVCGFDVETQSLEVRSQTSYLPGDARLYRTMQGKQVIRLFAGLHKYGDADLGLGVAERLQLDVSRRVMFMSTGMRQKLALAVVLGCRAPLIILDEPTANLDPNIRESILELVREVRADGRTVLLSSHIFSDIDDTCDQVAILRDGKIVAEQDMHALGKVHIVSGELDAELRQELVKAAKSNASVCHLFVEASNERDPSVELHLRGDPQQWMSWLQQQPLQNVSIERAGIRSVYQQYHSRTQLVDLVSSS